MTLNLIKNLVCGKLHLTNSTQYEAGHTDMVNVCNTVLDSLYGAISWKNLNYFGTFTDENLVGTTRIYVIPDEILNKLKRIEVKLGGSGSYVWKPLIMKEINDIPNFVFDEVWITSNYDNENPVGFIMGNALYILSGTVPTETNGIRYYWLKFPNEIASMEGTIELSKVQDNFGADGQTITIGLPRQFHRLVADAMVIDYKEANEIPLSLNEQKYEKILEAKLNELSPLLTDENFQASIKADDGSEY